MSILSSVPEEFADIISHHGKQLNSQLTEMLSNRALYKYLAYILHPKMTRVFPWLVYQYMYFSIRRHHKKIIERPSFFAVYATQIISKIFKIISYVSYNFEKNTYPKESKSGIYISNHRDILLDPILFGPINNKVSKKHLETALDYPYFAFGDNLVKNSFLEAFMGSCSRSLLVKRGIKSPKERFRFLRRLSGAIRFLVEKEENVWIAQADGRSKNNKDKTSIALLKMLYLKWRQDMSLTEWLEACPLRICSISYEYDACDIQKANELYQKRTVGEYIKKEMEDIEDVLRSVTHYNGHIHLAVMNLKNTTVSSIEELAEQIDTIIYKNYMLFQTNLTAYRLQADKNENSIDIASLCTLLDVHKKNFYSTKFIKHIRKAPSHLKDILIEIYANPVHSKIATLS